MEFLYIPPGVSPRAPSRIPRFGFKEPLYKLLSEASPVGIHPATMTADTGNNLQRRLLLENQMLSNVVNSSLRGQS